MIETIEYISTADLRAMRSAGLKSKNKVNREIVVALMEREILGRHLNHPATIATFAQYRQICFPY